MLADILVALLITAVAIVLGVVVHPVLFFLIILAIVWLFARRGGRRHVGVRSRRRTPGRRPGSWGRWRPAGG
ncbi:hypothetical protein GHK86_20490, partial [Acidimicrobiaceae bacterium USS-CC1]|nr:hypothetical protein [Acidiferrimicrobium australe]